jgi:uncharacterized protein YoxC
MELNIANVGLMITLVSCIVGILTYNFAKKKSDTKEIKEDTTAQTRLEMQLEYIKQGVDDIKSEMREMKDDAKSQEKKITALMEKLARVDESLKSAWNRINEMESKITSMERK